MQLGYIMARVYTSDAEIPIQDAVFTVTGTSDSGETLYGVRVTDENGKTELIPVDAPDKELSLTPGNTKPYTTVDVRIDHPEFVTKYVTDVQVFAGQVSVQNAPMLPIGEHRAPNQRAERYDVTSQNL